MTYPPQPPQQPYGQPYGTQPPVSGAPAPPPPYGPPPGYPPAPAPKKTNPWTVIGIVIGVFAALCLGGGLIASLAGGDSTTGTAAPLVATPPPAAGTEPAEDAAENPPAAEDPPAEEAARFDVKLGTTLTVEDGDSVQEWSVMSSRYRKSCGGLTEAENGGFLIIEVQVVQKSGTGAVNPLFLEFVDAEGATANALSAAFSGCEKQSLDSTNGLRAGQRRSGQVAYDVASAKGSVELTPGLLDQTAGSWKVG